MHAKLIVVSFGFAEVAVGLTMYGISGLIQCNVIISMTLCVCLGVCVWLCGASKQLAGLRSFVSELHSLF